MTVISKIIVDPSKCSGCRVCEAICSLINEGIFNPTKSRIKVIRMIKGSPAGLLYSVPVVCQQCEEAYCQKVCPVRAIYRNNKGALVVDEQKCIGCRLCEAACPIGAISVDIEKHVALKCNLCERIGEPQCVKYCFDEAIKLVPADRASRAIAISRAERFREIIRKVII
ncbi:MAG: 4Fe-4S dicluster domain-containing protein [Candidatus Bathyarchaeia archaeon]